MKLLKTLIFVLAALSMAWAKPPRPVIIDPTVFAFDSIPPVETDLTFFIDTVQDTSQQRNTTAIVGTTRVRRMKMASIISDPPPAEVIKNSLVGLLGHHRLLAEKAEQASSIISIEILDCTLTETYSTISQTMTADISLRLTLRDRESPLDEKKYVIKSQNSKSSIDMSKHAGPILQEAVESALREILKTISKQPANDR